MGLKDRSGQLYTYEKESWVQERDVQGGFSEGSRCVKGCQDSIAILWLCLLLYLVQKSVHSQEAEEAQETLRRRTTLAVCKEEPFWQHAHPCVRLLHQSR